INPGIRVGTQLDLKKWKGEADQQAKLKSFYLSPQLGIYTQSDVKTGFLVNTDWGYKSVNPQTTFYRAFSLGVGTVLESQITERGINLGTGEREVIRASTWWLLPTINAEWGKEGRRNLGWYGKLSYGQQLAANRGSNTVFLVELGLKFKIGRHPKAK
ncbi:MAG: hypothetical protein AAF840_01845, partial [Bacteroidota bacterium]